MIIGTVTPRPASGVIAAGVQCKGNKATAQRLAAIAGVPTPEYPGYAYSRPDIMGKPCLSCGKPLFKWTRNPADVPEGYVMHRGRQYCVNCRKAYNAALKAEGPAIPRGIRKRIDRKRHHAITAAARAATRERRRRAEVGEQRLEDEAA